MDIVTLHCFLAVAELGSFTKAAVRVERTQSAVSQQITKLEKEIGTSLINRGKQLTLTPEGKIFLEYAEKIFSLYRELLDRIKNPELQGKIRFGLTEDFAMLLLSDTLAEFSRIHPRISLYIESDLTNNLIERFNRKEFDIILAKMRQPKDFPVDHEVWNEILEWVGKPNLLQDLEEIPLIMAPSPSMYRDHAIETLDKASKKWRIVFSSYSYCGTVAAVEAGIGVTVLPRSAIPNHLKPLRSAQLPKLQDFYIGVLKHDGKNNKAVSSFEEFLMKSLGPAT